MEVLIRVRRLPAAQALRLHARQRLQDALGRFAQQLRNVTVSLAAGRSERADKEGRVVLELRGEASLVVETRGMDLPRLIDRLAVEAQRRLAGHLQRRGTMMPALTA